ncbi:MAG: hypothetical protein AAF074_19615 [Pseudomonadota bacterium]
MRQFLQPRTGALGVLAVCFVASAVLRAGEVLAERPELGERLAEAAAGFTERVDPELVENSAVLRELDRQREMLAAREAALAEREAALAETEARMAERLAELKAARDELAAAVAGARGAAEKDVAHLASMYEQMKPKAAGALFNEMAPAFAAGFLGEMRTEAAAAILANMETRRAYAVSVLMAGRNVPLSGPAN